MVFNAQTIAALRETTGSNRKTGPTSYRQAELKQNHQPNKERMRVNLETEEKINQGLTTWSKTLSFSKNWVKCSAMQKWMFPVYNEFHWSFIIFRAIANAYSSFFCVYLHRNNRGWWLSIQPRMMNASS